jgi:acid phosphatase (class A)
MKLSAKVNPALIGLVAIVGAVSALSITVQARGGQGYLPATVVVENLRPPLPGSPEELADRQAALTLQANRTPARVALAQSDRPLDIYSAYGSVLGPRFTAAATPKLKALIDRVNQDTRAAANRPKEIFKRPRPPKVDPNVQNCLELPEGGSNSFPSGHAMWGNVTGLLLARLIPEKGTQLRARGLDFGFSRAVCGVHYPTDVRAGQQIGEAVVSSLLAEPSFRADLMLVKEELKSAGLTR